MYLKRLYRISPSIAMLVGLSLFAAISLIIIYLKMRLYDVNVENIIRIQMDNPDKASVNNTKRINAKTSHTLLLQISTTSHYPPTVNLESKTNPNLSKLNTTKWQRIFHQPSNLNQNHSIRISELKPFQIQITLEERQMMYTLLEVFDKTMKENNITYFMYGGTLLGSYRHHDLIPWDDDLDVILPLTIYKEMENVLKPLLPDYILTRAGGHDKLYHKYAKKSNDYKWLWPYLDISYYEENSTFIKDWVQTYGKWYYFPKEIVFPLHYRPLFNLFLPAPKDTFAFLTWTNTYGSQCYMGGYSHMVEGRGPHGTIDCKLLSYKFPFVEHFPDENGVREVLKYKDMVISDIVIPEPLYAVSETFQLSLKTEYTMPIHITPPS